jgi:adenylate cyclase
MDTPSPSQLRVRMLGGFDLTGVEGGDLTLPRKKLRALVALLALGPAAGWSRERLTALLWGDRDEEQARGSLRQALAELRRILGESALLTDRDTAAFDRAAVHSDAEDFARLAAAGELEQAAALYRGDLLDGVNLPDAGFADWLLVERTRLHDLAVGVLTRLLDTQSGDAAIATAQRLLQFDPAREETHRALMQLYAVQGNRCQALRQYQLCRDSLQRDLGVKPEPETERLFKEIQSSAKGVMPGQARRPPENDKAASDMNVDPRRGDIGVKSIAEPARPLLDSVAGGATISEQYFGSWRWPATIAAALVLLVLAGAAAWWHPWEPAIEPAAVDRMTLPLPDKSSIAVLPFTNMSGDPEQEYFADGMTDDLITDLSKVSSLFVIARNSTFVYKGQMAETRQVAEDLGVRYVVEGSVRRAGNTVRVNAQLVDTTTGGHVWADRYDSSVTDIFAVQDSIVREIVGALALSLSEGEQEEIARGQTVNVQAREAFQKGWEHYLRFTAEDNAKAAEYFKQAAETDPEYGRAYAALGIVYVRGCQWRWNEELGMTPSIASQTAMGYLSEAERNTSSLTKVAASQIHLYNERHEDALTEAARAIALDPNDPEAHVAMALAMITTGTPKAGLEFVETALRLNPSHPGHYVLAHGMAYFSMNDLERAAAVLGEGLERQPGAVELAPFLAATYARLGRREDARATFLRWQPDANQHQLESVSLRYHFPYPWSADERAVQNRLADGLYIAALPLDVTIATLVKALHHEHFAVRRSAAQDLGRFGPAAVDAVPALINALVDENSWVQTEVVRALGKIGPAAEAAIPALRAIQDDHPNGLLAQQALKDIAGF